MRPFLKIGFFPARVILCALFVLSSLTFAGTYGGGSGTAEDPYKISTKADLLALAGTLEDYVKCFVLTTDVDLGGQVFSTAIIARDIAFSGTFDGGGHVISHWTINGGSNDYLGLFGNIGPGGLVRNLGVEDYTISGSSNSCYLGGLCGRNFGTIRRCYATGSVIEDSPAGKFGSCYLGGLCGANTGTISQCYAAGFLKGYIDVGGLVGFNGGSITQSFSTVKITWICCHVAGGLCGRNTGEISGCFWDIQTGFPYSDGGTGKPTAEMKTLSTFISAGWDFVNTWFMPTVGYPRLQWEGIAGYGSLEVTILPGEAIAEGAKWRRAGTTEWLDSGQIETGIPAGLWEVEFKQTEHWRRLAAIPITISPDGFLQIEATYTMGFSGGTGTAQDPYRISTVGDWEELTLAPGDWGKHFVVTNDIDFGGAVIRPVVTDANEISGTGFTGVFDGKGHAIRNAVIDLPTHTDVGLFGFVETSGQIRDLGIENIAVTGAENTGGLCGTNAGIVTGCYSTGAVKGAEYYVGGLCGRNIGTISQCYTTESVTVSFIWYFEGGYVGGLCGHNTGMIIGSCAKGYVSGNYSVGGLCGWNDKGTIHECFAVGTVTGEGYGIGGLCGRNDQGNISGSFWDVETSGQTVSGGGEGKTTAEMKTLATFTEAGWDFVYSDGNPPVWKMGPDGYPALFWEFRYSGGSGTAEDPYKISTVTDWRELIATPADWDKSFVLLNDIDFGGANLTPVAPDTDSTEDNGFQGTPFSGSLDGNHHVLSNFKIDESDKDYIGLIGQSDNGEIWNLGLVNATINGRDYVGGLVGDCYYGTITACYTTGSISSSGQFAGGLAGRNVGNTITSCYVTGAVIGGSDAGGLIGFNSGSGTITSCYTTGSVIGVGPDVGGLAGSNEGTITSCSATGSVSGPHDVGGLVGNNYNFGTILSCYATGSVTGSSAGGLVGSNGGYGVVKFSYATGSVNGFYDYIGGLVGENNHATITSCFATGSVSFSPPHGIGGGLVGGNELGTITSCFWDMQTSGLNYSAEGTGKTTAEMKTLSTFTDAGWDFVGEAANGTTDVWRMCGDGIDYPRLSWEFSGSGDFACPDGVALEDLLYLAGRWLAGTPESAGAADANGDGKVDLEELSLLSQYWLENRGPITLEVYSDGWGTLIGTFTVAEEGSYELKITDERPYYYPPEYFVFISRDGYYTEQFLCTGKKSPGLPAADYRITVDVDLDPIAAATFNGTIFLTQYFFHHSPLNQIGVMAKGDGTTTVFQTDSQGRFAADLAPGSYVFEFTVPDDSTPYVEPVVIDGPYQDIRILNHIIALKPNIYLYPENELDLRVWLSFPYGGQIVSSSPEYGDGWNITATPSGIIDGRYGYLFYESVQGDRCQYQRGWVIGREDLSGFFRQNLDITGFNDIEISDFLSYWIPRLDEFPYYAIYPQYNADLARMSELEFSVRPDSVLRLMYSIRGLETDNLVLPAPEIPVFEPTGFVVREWGVMLK
ncbi:MAG: hypothetical protein GX455_08390 [Phycisphaerae bacterium]|nr:hypothetical protein [Phycisphaerae bacterium]